MDASSTPRDQFQTQTVDAVAQFAALMHARERRRCEQAREAREQLRRLGIVIRFAGTAKSATEEVRNG